MEGLVLDKKINIVISLDVSLKMTCIYNKSFCGMWKSLKWGNLPSSKCMI